MSQSEKALNSREQMDKHSGYTPGVWTGAPDSLPENQISEPESALITVCISEMFILHWSFRASWAAVALEHDDSVGYSWVTAL